MKQDKLCKKNIKYEVWLYFRNLVLGTAVGYFVLLPLEYLPEKKLWGDFCILDKSWIFSRAAFLCFYLTVRFPHLNLKCNYYVPNCQLPHSVPHGSDVRPRTTGYCGHISCGQCSGVRVNREKSFLCSCSSFLYTILSTESDWTQVEEACDNTCQRPAPRARHCTVFFCGRRLLQYPPHTEN